jgi:hypothetical protein
MGNKGGVFGRSPALMLVWTTLITGLSCLGLPARPESTTPVERSAVPAVTPSLQQNPGASAQGITYYVRPDGGSAAQCTGRANAPYPGSGTAQPCAWDHPFRALPPGGTPRIAGEDTLIIAPGSYMMGLGAPGRCCWFLPSPWRPFFTWTASAFHNPSN